MNPQKTIELQNSYDAVAQEYVRRIYDELKEKPLDRQLLDRFAADVREQGMVCDVGCGPGQVAKYLTERGVNVIGIDLSAKMVEQARRLNPTIEFRQNSMLALAAEHEAWAGITAFYSIIHIPRDEVVSALVEFRRVLQPAGVLLLAFHIGEEIVHLEEWWE
nr:class I SAM-dependent methyltransferase [Acidobacteriota bacterium]